MTFPVFEAVEVDEEPVGTAPIAVVGWVKWTVVAAVAAVRCVFVHVALVVYDKVAVPRWTVPVFGLKNVKVSVLAVPIASVLAPVTVIVTVVAPLTVADPVPEPVVLRYAPAIPAAPKASPATEAITATFLVILGKRILSPLVLGGAAW
jgi:hypothetical protein